MGCCKSKDVPYKWIKCQNGDYPPNAVEGGYYYDELGKKTMYLVARHWHEGDLNLGRTLVPGRFDTKNLFCYIAWGGVEHEYNKDYEILVSPPGILTWVPSERGKKIDNAVVGGEAESGELLYIARVTLDRARPYTKGTKVTFQEIQVPGKVHPSHHFSYIPYGGHETAYSNYDVLVYEPH